MKPVSKIARMASSDRPLIWPLARPDKTMVTTRASKNVVLFSFSSSPRVAHLCAFCKGGRDGRILSSRILRPGGFSIPFCSVHPWNDSQRGYISRTRTGKNVSAGLPGPHLCKKRKGGPPVDSLRWANGPAMRLSEKSRVKREEPEIVSSAELPTIFRTEHTCDSIECFSHRNPF